LPTRRFPQTIAAGLLPPVDFGFSSASPTPPKVAVATTIDLR
jgi:hypothetical protein